MKGICIALAAFLATGPASAAETVSLALVPIHGPDNASVAEKVDEALRRAVMESAAMHVRAAAVPSATLSMLQDTFECSEARGNWPNCMAAVGKPIGAHRIVWGTLDYDKNRWSLGLRMLDVQGRHMIKALDRTLPDTPTAVYQLAAVAENFVRPADYDATVRAQLRIVSVPPKAKITLDGLEISPTPVTVPVAPGAHEVIATLPELGTERRLIQASPGETLVSFRFIAPSPTPETIDEEVPDMKLDWRFWSGIGSVTLAAIAGAGYLHFGAEATTDRNLAAALLNEAEGDGTAFTAEESERYQSLQSSFEQNNSYRYSMFFGAATAAIAGGVLLHMWGSDGPSLAPTTEGVAVSGTF